MQERNNELGCLTGRINRVGCGLDGSVSRIGHGLTGCIDSVGEGITGFISLVCTVNRDAYLRVSTDVLWLTPEMLSEHFDIYSNVNWNIN